MTEFRIKLENNISWSSKMKKICYVINSDWYFELHWIERALAVKQAGNEIHVICNFVGNDIQSRLESFGFICYSLNVSAHSLNPVNFITSFFKVWRIVSRIKPDILHCVTIKACIIGGLYARFKCKPVILSFAGLGRVFDNTKKKFNLIQFFVLKVYKHIFANPKCMLVFENEFDREKLVNLSSVNIQKTIIIDGAGINTNDYPYTPEPVYNIPVVLFASRMLWSKGLSDLIAAKVLLEKINVFFHLNVAGIVVNEDSDAIPLKKIEQWHNEGHIKWLGKSTNVCQLIKDSNIVALPSSYSEGVPRILLEAASVGRAAITYDVGGCKSLILDSINGYVINKGDIDCLVSKLKILLQNPDVRYKMGLASRDIALNKFSSAIVITKTLGIYDNILKMPFV